MSVRIGNQAVVERCLLVAGLVLLTAYAGVSVYRSVASNLALREFESAQAAPATSDGSQVAALAADESIDFNLWSKARVRAYRESAIVRKGAPLAILTIERLHIHVPVFEGTDELALNRGVGWIPGTTRPGKTGNIGIAGHRDGFFRGLKDAAIGDVIDLSTTPRPSRYTVDAIEIVRPEDVRVLLPRATPALTLVTCYPFYIIGAAPRRFIVHAALVNSAIAADNNANRSPSREPDK